eukprot:957772-Amphidinium_carterae.1
MTTWTLRKHVLDKQEWKKALGTLLEGLTPEVSQPLTHPEEAYPAVILDHAIPLQPTRTNVIAANQTPRSRLFGAFTVRGSGVTQATYRFPKVLEAIHRLASTRPTSHANAPYAAAQLTQAQFLPCHRDMHNLGISWLIGLGDYE